MTTEKPERVQSISLEYKRITIVRCAKNVNLISNHDEHDELDATVCASLLVIILNTIFYRYAS